jgi:DNA-binding LacI/PurR family transcriptional regulator
VGADRVDGIVLIGGTLQRTVRQTDMECLVQTHRHVVSVASRPSVAGEVSITVDNAAGVTLALDHLAALGHRRLAYLYEGHKPTCWEHEQRRAAYCRFMHTHGPTSEVAVAVRDDTIEAAQDAVHHLLDLNPRPTAVVVNNDLTAIRILMAALMCGVRVPGDLSAVALTTLLSQRSAPLR